MTTSLQRRFNRCLALVEEAKTAEKAKVASLEEEVTLLSMAHLH